jgi:hypothetical protein
MGFRRGRWTNRPLGAVSRWRARSMTPADARVVEQLPREPGIQTFERGAHGSPSAVRTHRWPRWYFAGVELPPRLLGTIIPEPSPGWTPSPAWNAPLTIARLPTLVAGGDFIAGEPTTRGAVLGAGNWVSDHTAIAERRTRRFDARRCLADSTPTAGLGGHLVDDGHEQPRLEICVYRYGQLPEGLRDIVDERPARRWRPWGRAESSADLSLVAWGNDWFLADGTCITDLFAPEYR